MAELTIALVMIVLLCAASIWANRRFRDEDRLPMQWSLSGDVNWTAPRRVALALMPALGALILGGMALAILASGSPRPGQENLEAPVVLLGGLIILAIHGFHLWMIERTVR